MTANAFDRLRALLDGVPAPAGLPPLALHLGEPRLAEPAFDPAPLADAEGWTRYPPLGGTPGLRAAYEAWLGRRFGVGAALGDGRITTEPTPGSKQAVAALLLLAAREADGPAPAVLLPSPCYPTYLAATDTAGARPVYYDGHDVGAAARAAGGPVAAVVVCDPGNPRGDVWASDALEAVSSVARDAGAVLVVDECYVDLALDRAPEGFLSLVERSAADPGAYAVLHSLSKRSGAPGLRSGFVAGDPATVAAYAALNRSCGVSSPAPVCAVAAALWADDAHVETRRAALARNWDVADAVLGDLPGYRRADAGFFLWLPVADDERTARDLWREQALTVMPGRYLAAGDGAGTGRLRIALVHPEPVMREALARLRAGLTYEALSA